MRYALEFTASAARELERFDKQVERRITTKITSLSDDPFPGDVKKMKGLEDHFRIRIGDYRVVYRVDGKRVIVVIVRVGHRREIYR
jgi:mRNA interferase RelE/StbE